MKIIYVTGNAAKFRTAKKLFGEMGVKLEQAKVDVYEIC